MHGSVPAKALRLGGDRTLNQLADACTKRGAGGRELILGLESARIYITSESNTQRRRITGCRHIYPG